MTVLLTFIIPVRHPMNSTDWGLQIRRLSETASSIANQTAACWRAIVVADVSATLPRLPPQFEIARVGFPPNPCHDREKASIDLFYDMVRLDKGRRVLAGLERAFDSEFAMVVDDDDFVSCKLVEYISKHRVSNGWVIRNGLVWGDGGSIVYRHPNFSTFCGTSHIVKTNLYGVTGSAQAIPELYIKRLLGSHRFIESHLAANGTPLETLPFPGAIYRIGHTGAHSRSNRILPTFVFNWKTAAHPLALASNIARLSLLSNAVRDEFFGSRASQLEDAAA